MAPALSAGASQVLLNLALLSTLAACASSPDCEGAALPRVLAGEFGEAACFHPAWVGDFEVLDGRNLIVFAPGAREAAQHRA